MGTATVLLICCSRWVVYSIHAVAPKGESIRRGRGRRPTHGFLGLFDNWNFGMETMPHNQIGQFSPFLEGEVLGGQGVSRGNFKKITLAPMENERPIGGGGANTYVANGTLGILLF